MEGIRDIYYMLLDSYEYHYNKIVRDVASEEIRFVLPCIDQISVNAPLSKLLFLPVFRRLKDVKQLAHTHIYLPGAMHTRYEHSLGVMAISLKVLEKLRGALKEKVNIDIDDRDRIILGIAALLHDIGHASWGHALDGLTGTILSYFIELLDENQLLSNVRKLDIALAFYLLEHNEQLMKFFESIVVEVEGRSEKAKPDAEELRRELRKKAENLRKIVWLIISEEWNLEYLNSILKDAGSDWIAKIKLFQTIIGSPGGVGGVNTDRLDWIVRDSHHTYVEMHVPDIGNDLLEVNNIVKKIIERGNIFDIVDLVDSSRGGPKVVLKNDIANRINNLREKLYAYVYEGFERAFTDSLLTRLAYSAVKVLYHAGIMLSGPSTVLKVITSYLIQPDHDLINFTRRILDIANNIDLADYGIIEPVDQQFIRNSSRLIKFLDNIDRVVHSLRSQPQKELNIPQQQDLNIYVSTTSIPFFEVKISSITCEVYGKLIERRLKAKDVDGKAWLVPLVYEYFISSPRIDPFKVLEVGDIEGSLYGKISEAYGSIARFINAYVLPNYYVFRKLCDAYQRNMDKMFKVDDIIELMKGQNVRKCPVLIVLTECREGYCRDTLDRLAVELPTVAIEKLSIHIDDYIEKIEKLIKAR